MPKRILEGNVVSDKMDKTVTVLVERRYKHPMYKKYVKRTDKYAAHDESNAFGVGDRVQIEECRPISKRKTWKVVTPASQGTAPKMETAPKKEEASKADVEEAMAAPAEKEEKKAATKALAKKAAAKKTAKKATSKKKDEGK